MCRQKMIVMPSEADNLILAKISWVLIDLAAENPIRASRRLSEVFIGVADAPPIDPDFALVPKFSISALKKTPILRLEGKNF